LYDAATPYEASININEYIRSIVQTDGNLGIVAMDFPNTDHIDYLIATNYFEDIA